jgi:hypothetical protein
VLVGCGEGRLADRMENKFLEQSRQCFTADEDTDISLCCWCKRLENEQEHALKGFN